MVLAKQRYDVIWNRYNFPISMEGCVLYLPLWQEDMRASVLSYDQNARVGTVTGTTWDSKGRAFDGDDQISLPVINALSLSADFTVVLWVNLTLDPAAGQMLVSQSISSTDRFSLYFHTNNTLGGSCYDGTDWSATSNYTMTAGWHCIIYGHDGTTPSNSRIYVDLAVGSTSSLGSTTTTVAHYLGCKTDLTSYLIGSVGEYHIYSRLFAAAERANIYWRTKWRY